MPDAVLIASPEQVQRLTADAELQGALAFAHHDALAAFAVIAESRPRVVALETSFAESPRGAALIHRIKADPSLQACEVRIVGGGSPAAMSATAESNPGHGLDHGGTRAAVRVAMRAGVTVSLDGHQVQLVNLSPIGALVLAGAPLRPNQRVRLAFASGERPIRHGALVRWATFEMPAEGARFRAGLAFTNADSDAMSRFIEAHRA